jgi:hypothetical protein
MKKIMAGVMISVLMGAGAVGLAEEKMDFNESKSTHFIVYSAPDVPQDFINTMTEYAERYYGELTDKLGFTLFNYWTWDNRAKIYIYASQEEYVRQTGQPSWSGGAAAYEKKTIWTYPRGAGFFDSLLPHELGHIILHEVIGEREVPLWFEEGVASYSEAAKRFGSDQIIKNALANDTFMPLSDLSKIDGATLRSGTNVDLFYAEAISLITYLIDNFGVDRFNRLCEKLKDGKKMDDALAYAYFDIRNIDDLGKFWEESLRRKADAKIRTML